MRILLAIPVYNEVRHVDDVLAKAKTFNCNILVIDDGSSDGTAEKLAGRKDVHVLRHVKNQGYGQSLIDAFAFAAEKGFDWVITMDCDEQHEPEMIPAFKKLIAENHAGGADIISGTRYKRRHDDDNDAPADRAAINGILTRILNSLYGMRLTDSFCGFKAHRVSAMEKLTLTETGYAFPLQLWPQAVAADLKIIEMPVRRIYVDPNRTFGGNLDQPTIRLTHYLDVLAIEHQKLFGETLDLPTARDLLAGTATMPVRPTPLERTPATSGAHGCIFCGCL